MRMWIISFRKKMIYSSGKIDTTKTYSRFQISGKVSFGIFHWLFFIIYYPYMDTYSDIRYILSKMDV